MKFAYQHRCFYESRQMVDLSVQRLADDFVVAAVAADAFEIASEATIVDVDSVVVVVDSTVAIVAFAEIDSAFAVVVLLLVLVVAFEALTSFAYRVPWQSCQSSWQATIV